VLARVGKEAITAGDLLASVAHATEEGRGKMSEEEFREQREKLTELVAEGVESIVNRQRTGDKSPLTRTEKMQRQIIRGLLQKKMQTLLVYADAKRTIPEEAFPQVETQVEEQFNNELLPKLMKRAGVKYRDEFEAVLRQRHSSIERERRHYFQEALAQQWIQQNVKFNEEITHAQMLEYYREHIEDFDRPAQTIWEHLTVHFSNHPNTDEARAKIARMGNQVLAGTPLSEVAKKHSDGVTAAEGGERTWPSDELLSDDVKKAIQGLPPGKLSPIIRDWRGLHIIRVVERRPAGRLPFEKVQEEIRQKIKNERVSRQIADYVAGLKQRTSVWTVFDNSEATQPEQPN